MTRERTVGLIVLNWNGWEVTKDCLFSLRTLSYPGYQVYVVDNGSADGSPEKIASSFPKVTLIQLPENRGFGGGMNAGIEAAMRDGHDYVLCMNNDTLAEPDFLEPLVAAAESGRVVPYPALYLTDEANTIDTLGNNINLMTGMTSMIAKGAREMPEHIDADYTEMPLLSRQVLDEVGRWREDYFAYYEDADLGLRIQKAGWRLVCVPESKVKHQRGGTANRIRGIKSYYSMRNRMMIVREHGSWWHYTTTILHIFVLTLPYILLRASLTSTYKHSVHHIVAGIADGLLPWRRSVSRSWQLGSALASTSKP